MAECRVTDARYAVRQEQALDTGMIKCLVLNLRDCRREFECFQARAAAEHCVADLVDALFQDNLLQRGTAVEDIAVNPADGCR